MRRRLGRRTGRASIRKPISTPIISKGDVDQVMTWMMLETSASTTVSDLLSQVADAAVATTTARWCARSS